VLILVRDAEGDQLPVELRDLILSLLQRRPRPLERSMLPLKRCPGIDEGGPLLLEVTLGLLAGGMLLPELLLRCDDRGGLVARAAFNSSASLALLSASLALSSAWLRWDRASSSSVRSCRRSARTETTSFSQSTATERGLSRSSLAYWSASSRSMRAVRTRSTAEARAVDCPSSSKSWSRRASAWYANQPS
jgi:hypothetical protein